MRVDVSRVAILFEVSRFSAVCYSHHARAELGASPARCRWRTTVDVVADRAGFVDNEPSFTNGSPVTKPGRLRPYSVLHPLILDPIFRISFRCIECDKRNVLHCVLDLHPLLIDNFSAVYSIVCSSSRRCPYLRIKRINIEAPVRRSDIDR